MKIALHLVLSILIVYSGGLSGQAASDLDPLETTTTNGTKQDGCDQGSGTGLISPLDNVTAEADADNGPVEADILITSTGAGLISGFVLEHEGEEVLSVQELVLVGNHGLHAVVDELDPGSYKLKVTTQAGVYDISATLTLTWDGGTC